MDSLNTNASLIQRARDQQDETSWEEFFRYYRPYIFAICLKMNVNYHDCEDLVQKILLALWEKLPDFEYSPEKSRFRTWLSKVVRNHVLNHFKKENSLQKKHDNVPESSEYDLPTVEAMAEEEWKHYISNLAWENVKGDFTEKTQRCFELLSDGHSPAKVAEEVGIDQSTVYVHKKRILERLYREIVRLDRDLY